MVSDAYAIHEYNAGTVSNRSGSISGSSDSRLFTSTQLAGVVASTDQTGCQCLGGCGHKFQDLTNWPSNYRATALRGFGDFLVASHRGQHQPPEQGAFLEPCPG